MDHEQAMAARRAICDIRQLQQTLNTHLPRNAHLLIDGQMGAKTRAALLSFQKNRWGPVTGQLDLATRRALGMSTISTIGPRTLLTNRPWFEVAKAELGMAEVPRPGHHNPRIVEYHQTTTLRANDDETPWCSSFVNWVFAQVGIRGTQSAAAKSWMTWGVEDTTPGEGTVVVIKKKGGGPDRRSGSPSGYHVAFLIQQRENRVVLLGGNQGNTVSVIPYSTSKHDILAYRLPSTPMPTVLHTPLV